MIVCFFGYPNETYSRSKILIDGLKKNKVKVILCTSKKGFIIARTIELFRKFWAIRNKIDVIFVQFPGHLYMPTAWLVGKIFRKPIIFDAFVSLYDTYIFDREVAKPDSLKAKFYWLVDKIACTLADKVTLDTNTHIKYFIKTFKLNRQKFYCLPVGGDDTLFKPRASRHAPRAKIVIEFHGMFTKIHGAEIFVQAAKKLENNKNIEFWLIGDSQNYRLPIELYYQLKPKNMSYWPRLSENILAKKIAQADVTIGHLGNIKKASRVISFKLMHGLAVGNLIIAPKTSASKEFLIDNFNCIMIPPNNIKILIKTIMSISKNKSLIKIISMHGYNLFKSKFTNKIIAKRLIDIISYPSYVT